MIVRNKAVIQIHVIFTFRFPFYLEDNCTVILHGNAPHQYSIEYRNNQTTSTKCQYQAAHSNPTIWSWELAKFVNRFNEINRKEVPMITWSP